MFKTITSVLDPSKNPSDEEIRKISSYIFCRWLSGNPSSIHAANVINLYYDIPVETQYELVKKSFAGKIKFIPYPKNSSEKTLHEIEILMKHFMINEEKAKDYLDLIDPKELSDIMKLYKTKR